MSRASILVRSRAAAEAGMTGTCTITRPGAGGRGEMNPASGKYDARPDRVTVYEGPFRMQVTAIIANSSQDAAGERVARVQGAELQLPVGVDGRVVVGSSAAVAVGDVAYVDTNPNDPALAGRELTVIALHNKSDASSRRLRVEEATG